MSDESLQLKSVVFIVDGFVYLFKLYEFLNSDYFYFNAEMFQKTRNWMRLF